jgi:lactoylglutathione lyase
MRIEHIALWTHDIERLRAFYERYFGAAAGARYENRRKQFQSYFVSFGDGARVELMQSPRVGGDSAGEERLGYAHLALALGSEAAVDALTGRLRADGYAVLDGPRHTGDGYYESAVLDPDGNRIELTV